MDREVIAEIYESLIENVIALSDIVADSKDNTIGAYLSDQRSILKRLRREIKKESPT